MIDPGRVCQFKHLFKPWRTDNLNSGVALYFSNSIDQSSAVRGGRIPVMGRHSVMLRPDSVRRVTPPTTMTAKTNAEETKSHRPTTGGASTGSEDVSSLEWDELVEKKRGPSSRSLADPCRVMTEYDLRGGKEVRTGRLARQLSKPSGAVCDQTIEGRSVVRKPFRRVGRNNASSSKFVRIGRTGCEVVQTGLGRSRDLSVYLLFHFSSFRQTPCFH